MMPTIFVFAIGTYCYDMHDLHSNCSTIPVDVSPMDTTQSDIAHPDCEPLSEEERQRKVRYAFANLEAYAGLAT